MRGREREGGTEEMRELSKWKNGSESSHAVIMCREEGERHYLGKRSH